MLFPLDLSPTFGFGDRLGFASPGHIAAVRGQNLRQHRAKRDDAYIDGLKTHFENHLKLLKIKP